MIIDNGKIIASFGQGEMAYLIDKESADPSCILTFSHLLQAKAASKNGQVGSPQDPVPLVVDSPSGKGIVLERRHGVDQAEHNGRPVNWLVLGEAAKAIRIFKTEDNIVHWADRPKQVVVDARQCLTVDRGQFKEGSEVLLYGLLDEGKGREIQQFVLNQDGTLSSMHAPGLIWGWEPPTIRKARMDEISAFVIKHANWPVEVDPSFCQTSELKGGASPLTESMYTVECPNEGITPSKVVLKRYIANPLRNKRMMAASRAFSRVGAAPALVASADSWMIETFAGQRPKFNTESWMRQMADLAVRCHSARTDWCDLWQEEIRHKYSCLQHVPVGSMIWSCVAYHDGNLERYSVEEMQQLGVAIPEALSMIGGEVVSTHGDLHQDNTVLTADEVLLAVDFEMSAVSQVRQDLLYSSWENGSNRRVLCTSYLKASGLPFNQREADLLAVDMILAAVVHFRILRGLFFPKEAGGGHMKMKDALSELNLLNRAVKSLKDNPARCTRVVDKTDVWKCMGNIGLLLDLCSDNLEQ